MLTDDTKRALNAAIDKAHLRTTATISCTEAICHELAALRELLTETLTPPKLPACMVDAVPRDLAPIEKWDAAEAGEVIGRESERAATLRHLAVELERISTLPDGVDQAEAAAGTLARIIEEIRAGEHRKGDEA